LLPIAHLRACSRRVAGLTSTSKPATRGATQFENYEHGGPYSAGSARGDR
jgi:hypothetical protein